MINQGIMFGGEGPVMEGTWYNLNTGDSFTVRDTFFEDNELIVQTMDGRMLKYSAIQNYVKSDKPIDTTGIKEQFQKDVLPPEVANLIENDDSGAKETYGLLDDEEALIYGNTPQSLGNINKQSVAELNPTATNDIIISKALGRKKLPDLIIEADWEFPRKEIDMLMNIMDISKNEIVNWYLDHLDMSIIALKVKKYIQGYLDENIVQEEIPNNNE